MNRGRESVLAETSVLSGLSALGCFMRDLTL
jgi:hypothetical protein